MTYAKFISGKLGTIAMSGIGASLRNYKLFPHQEDLTRWALRRGKAAVFADTGLGKMRMAIAWSDMVSRETGSPVIILCPLAVAQQFVAEGVLMGITLTHCREITDVTTGINITNYDRMHKFDMSIFSGVALDESSIIKSHASKTLGLLMDAFRDTPYKLCCTATPSPNDWTELGTHAEFLGVRSRAEMLAEFFVHDGGDTSVWRIKGHARSIFWKWVSSWGAMIRSPADLGHDASAYQLPPLTIHQHTVDLEHNPDHGLFALEAQTLSDRRKARRASMDQRVKACADMVNSDNEPWIVWCDLNDEGNMLERAISGSVQVSGEDSIDFKEQTAEWFVGRLCICTSEIFSAKLSAWKKQNTNEHITQQTEIVESQNHASINEITPKKGASTTRLITQQTKIASRPRPQSTEQELQTQEKQNAKQSTQQTLNDSRMPQKNGRQQIQKSDLIVTCANMESLAQTTIACSMSKKESAQYAKARKPATVEEEDSTLIIATIPEEHADCSARNATSDSENLRTQQIFSNELQCICGHASGRRVLVSKSSIFGWGLNFQHCANQAFVGVNDSYEGFYQAVRRSWRFGQKRPVNVHVFASNQDGAVVANIRRKQAAAEEMAGAMASETLASVRESVLGSIKDTNSYSPSKSIAVPSFLVSE